MHSLSARLLPQLSVVRAALNWRTVAGLLVSAAAVLLALRGVHIDQVAAGIQRASIPLLLLAIASCLASTVASTLRWQLLLSPHRAPLGWLVFIFFVSQLCNAALPGKLGAPLRAALTSRGSDIPVAFALGSVAIERVLDTVLMAALSAALLLVLPIPETVRTLGQDTVWIAGVVALFLAAAVALTPWLRRQLAGAARHLGVAARLTGMLDALDVLRRGKLYAPLFALSVIIWLLGALVNALVLGALNVPVPWWTAILLLVALQLGGKLPSSPANIGVFHYIVVLVLTGLGVDASEAMATAVVLHAVVFVPPAVAGAVCLWRITP